MQIEKLPKWAQEHIRDLNQKIDDNRKAIKRLTPDHPDTDTVADPYARTPIQLPKGVSVEFELGDGRDQRIHVRVRGDELYVMGMTSVSITPKSSNTFVVKVVD